MRPTHDTAGLIRKAIVAAALLAACHVPHAPAQASRRADLAAARRSVRSFLTFHFAHDMGFSGRGLRLRRRWLTPGLYGRLRAELRKDAGRAKTHPDEAPGIEGDPFTDSQEYPNSFRVGRAAHAGDGVEVKVTFVWGGRAPSAARERAATVLVAKHGGRWLVADIVGENGGGILSAPGR